MCKLYAIFVQVQLVCEYFFVYEGSFGYNLIIICFGGVVV